MDPETVPEVAEAEPAQTARLKGELWSWMLQDKRMMERGGYLVPREIGSPAAEGPAAEWPAEVDRPEDRTPLATSKPVTTAKTAVRRDLCIINCLSTS